ncbi:MAG: hypothetical protein RIK87_17125 [Fuerstiella sp.]
MKTKTTPSRAADAADRKTTIYFASPEEKAEVERIGALMMPGMTPQMFLVAIA